MKKFEVTARTVEDAITEATLKLGATSDKIEYIVNEEGSAGFFGIGKKDASITVWLKEEEQKEKKKEKKPKKEKKEKTEKAVKKNSKSGKKQKSGQKEERPAKDVEAALDFDIDDQSDDQMIKPKKEKDLTSMNEDNIKACEAYLASILDKLGLEAEIRSREEEDHSLYMEVVGDDMGLIIGKRGQTLDALQYLINRIANHNQDGTVRVRLDTENYRERRKKTLENLAKNIASKAKKTRKNVVLEPMNPYERMIIHSTLQKDPSVTTYSKGKEPYRTVVVALKK